MTASALLVEPAFQTGPTFTRTLGPEVADLATLAGFEPDPEQRLGLDLLFAMDAVGKSAAFEFAVICSRQNLKTGLFKQAALGWLFITDQRLVVWSAHEFPIAQEAFRDMEQLIAGTPFLSKQIKRVWRGSGNEAIELRSGQRMKFRARTKSGGRGLTGDRIVLDEAFALQPDHMGALLPTLSVVPDPQIVYGSSAGLASSEVLRGIRDRGRSGSSPRLAYIEWCMLKGGCETDRCDHSLSIEGCALDDFERLHDANPLLGRVRSNGTGLTVEYVKAERQALPPEEFGRERAGWWDEPGVDEVFGVGKWVACAKDPQPVGLKIGALGLAVSFDQLRASIGAAAVDGDRVRVKPLRSGPGSSWAVAGAKELQATHGVDVVVDEKGPAASLIPALVEAGVQLKIVNTANVLDACADLFDMVQEERLAHESYPELDKAVAGAVKRSVGERWAWGRKISTADVSPLEAVTLASWWAAQVRTYQLLDSVR